MKFTPVKFQATLASAGVALMPMYFLKFNIFKTNENISLSMLSLLSDQPVLYATALFLAITMGLFIVIHFFYTAVFLKELVIWLSTTNEFKKLINSHLTASTVFSPLISLPMSMIVLFGPTSFFFPQITENIQTFMLPAFILFAILWVALISFELKAAGVFFTTLVEPETLNFGWLLDVLAFGAVSLVGSLIANFADSRLISSSTAFMVFVTVFVGIALFSVKLAILIYQQIRSRQLPVSAIMPAYCLVIPPSCLLGFGFYQLVQYTGKTYGFDVSAISFIIINFSYFFSMSWFVFSIFLLKEYLKKDFLRTDYSPAQWGMV